jgi:hypothetical protein
LQPAALEVSLRASEELEQERRRLDQLWQQRLERARYEVGRCRRQYQAVEPENRLVARELEARWEEALRQQQQLEEEYARHRQAQPAGLTPAEREQILALSADLPAVWSAETTTAAERQQVVRLLLQRVVVTVVGQSEQVGVRLEWVGGAISEHTAERPVGGYRQRADHGRLLERARQLRAGGASWAEVARRVNGEGFRPPKRARQFTAEMLRRLLGERGSGPSTGEGLQAGEWWPSGLAGRLRMPLETVQRWMRVGWVHTRRLADSRRRWVVWADEDELERLRQLRECDLSWANRERRAELARPKPRPNP